MSLKGTSITRHLPIEPLEFYNALKAIWRPIGEPGGGARHKLGTSPHHSWYEYEYEYSLASGIAVSGGVDSMALATLCERVKRLPENEAPSNIDFRAFVVDHKMRSSSSEEAQLVANQLQPLGLL